MSFLDTYFIEPILVGSGYNIYNTAVYAIILILAVFLVYKLIKKMNITIDRSFFIGVMPFIALGGILRSLEDLSRSTGADANVLLITPLIYITIFAIALSSLLLSIGIQRISKISYHKIWFIIGIIVIIIGLSRMSIVEANGTLLMVGIFLMWVAVFAAAKFIASKKSPRLNSFLSFENIALLLTHLFDATTTFVALEFFPYFEQHVVTGFFIDTLGTWSIFLVKFVVVAIVLYTFDRELSKETEKRTFLKLVVMILGMGPGLRNFLRLMLGV
ncbi:DUF63 family protein [Candidatus Aenigmatarchaeota archaeon]